MNKIILKIMVLVALSSILPSKVSAQCANNIGFENGNFTGWTTATDSVFINASQRRYITPGINMGVLNYGGTDMYLGTVSAANATVGSKVIKVGNRAVRATADTVYRTYIIDSLSDKLTIYSYGVVELAHNYWGVPINEAPGFGYEILVNGQKLDCLRGAFFCGNVDNPPVWQLGTFKDTAGVRKSTGWGEETLNFACFVGDTVEIRLFTRDCILLGHFAYAYFDVVCGDTSKPVISQISVQDILASDYLDLFCTQDATLELEPNTEICPIYRGTVQWSPQSFIIGSTTVDSALIHVPDSFWIYAEAQFSNFCQTIDVIDSIFVRYWAYDPHDNIPKLDNNYCSCENDTLDFTDANISSILDNYPKTYTVDAENRLIFNPCDNFYTETTWKNPSTRVVTNGSQIGTSPWSSGNTEGAISYDTLTGAGTVRFEVQIQAGKSFYIGLNSSNSNNGQDMDQYLYVNGTSIRAYYRGSNLSNLGTFSGTAVIDFEILANGRVRIYINGVFEYSYSSSRSVTFPVFADYSANSNNTNHVYKTSFRGPTTLGRVFDSLQNKTTQELYLTYVDRCGITVRDTIRYIPGLTAALLVNDYIQCGLNQVQFNMNTSWPSTIEGISWSGDASGTFTPPAGNGSLNTTGTSLLYDPNVPDYNLNPVTIIVTAFSGSCSVNDTAYLDVNEIPLANAGPDISTTADTFNIGGAPSGSCLTCGSLHYNWNNGGTMNDSTLSDPSVYKSLVLNNEYIVRAYDSTTGCYSFDTTYVYTSLPTYDNHLHADCINGHTVEFRWVSIPSETIKKFSVEYSDDGGRSWKELRSINASGQFGSVAQQYNMSIEKVDNPAAIYRWVTINNSGERVNVTILDELSCSDIPTYMIYPNPFTNELELNIFATNGSKLNYTFEIYNQYGQLVYTKEVNYTESNMSTLIAIDGLNGLSSGVYSFNVKSRGESLYSTLLVKSN
ncbi:MAG: T9SS type A sorting domain-containing protein [Bacteroidia bacterium]|nr:T9SS type A sorting domain-containing protein [Bacteroidia bacterium]